MTIDSDGNVVVTGWSIGSAGYTDYVTIWYSRTGISLGTNRYSGVGVNSGGNAIIADKFGNVFVTGYLSSGSTTDFGTIKYAGMMEPSLRASHGVSQITISWPSRFTEFVLQESSNIESGRWDGVTEVPVDDGMSKRVSLSGGAGQKFFRLSR